MTYAHQCGLVDEDQYPLSDSLVPPPDVRKFADTMCTTGVGEGG